MQMSNYVKEDLVSGYTGKFVIHSHQAIKAHLHFDLRLEFPVHSLEKSLSEYGKKRTKETPEPGANIKKKTGTVLRSWAVPKHKMPTTTPILATETEDHEISYWNFKGTIPEGSYGAGVVKIYDKGTYTLDKVTYDKKYVFTLHGRKEKGTYALIKTGHKNFLWIKVKKKLSCVSTVLKKMASAIDYVRPTLHAGIWDLQKDTPQIKEKVRKNILDVLSDSVKKDEIKSVFISGSATSYNYKEDGDLDIDVLINFNDQEKQAKMQAQLDKNREKKAPGTNLTYSFFLLSPGDFPKSDGIYDLLENKWVHGPIKIPEGFDPDKVFVRERKFAIEVMDRIYQLISEVKITLKDLMRVRQFIKLYDKIDPKRIVILTKLKDLCQELAKMRIDIWKLHKDSMTETPIYPAFNFSRDWDVRYILFKYIARYGGHEPVQLLYSMLGDDDVELVKKFMPDDAVGRFFKTASADLQEVYEDTIDQFESGKKKQPWELVKRSQALPVWKKFGGTGEVTKEGIYEIYELTKENLIKVLVNSMLQDSDHIDNENADRFHEFIKDEKNFGRRTDQDRRFNNALTVMEKAHTPVDQLLAVDRVFDLVHGSGPVANWFIEGGTATLSELQDWVPKSLVEQYHHKA